MIILQRITVTIDQFPFGEHPVTRCHHISSEDPRVREALRPIELSDDSTSRLLSSTEGYRPSSNLSLRKSIAKEIAEEITNALLESWAAHDVKDGYPLASKPLR